MSSSTRSITLPKLNVSKDMSLEKCEEHLSSYLQGNVTQRDDSSLIADRKQFFRYKCSFLH